MVDLTAMLHHHDEQRLILDLVNDAVVTDTHTIKNLRANGLISYEEYQQHQRIISDLQTEKSKEGNMALVVCP